MWDGCVVEYYGQECPLCYAEKEIKRLGHVIDNLEDSLEDCVTLKG